MVFIHGMPSQLSKQWMKQSTDSTTMFGLNEKTKCATGFSFITVSGNITSCTNTHIMFFFSAVTASLESLRENSCGYMKNISTGWMFFCQINSTEALIQTREHHLLYWPQALFDWLLFYSSKHTAVFMLIITVFVMDHSWRLLHIERDINASFNIYVILFQ